MFDSSELSEKSHALAGAAVATERRDPSPLEWGAAFADRADDHRHYPESEDAGGALGPDGCGPAEVIAGGRKVSSLPTGSFLTCKALIPHRS